MGITVSSVAESLHSFGWDDSLGVGVRSRRGPGVRVVCGGVYSLRSRGGPRSPSWSPEGESGGTVPIVLSGPSLERPVRGGTG